MLDLDRVFITFWHYGAIGSFCEVCCITFPGRQIICDSIHLLLVPLDWQGSALVGWLRLQWMRHHLHQYLVRIVAFLSTWHHLGWWNRTIRRLLRWGMFNLVDLLELSFLHSWLCHGWGWIQACRLLVYGGSCCGCFWWKGSSLSSCFFNFSGVAWGRCNLSSIWIAWWQGGGFLLLTAALLV